MSPSDLIAFVAVMISIASLVYAKRSTKAAEDGVAIARKAEVEANRSATAAELTALHEAQARHEDTALKVYIGFENPYPAWEAVDDDGSSWPDGEDWPLGSGIRNHRHMLRVGFRAILVNEDQRAIVVSGAALAGGETPLWPEPVAPPVEFDHRGRYLLRPGQAVLIDGRIEDTVHKWPQNWHPDDPDLLPTVTLYLHAAQDHGASKPTAQTISIGVDDWPIQPEDEGSSRFIQRCDHVGFTVQNSRADRPDSMADLNRLLQQPRR